MNDQLDHKTSILFSGSYWTSDGREHSATEMPLTYLEEEYEDRSVGIFGNVVVACLPSVADIPLLDEEDCVTVDLDEWITQTCEQNGGHNFMPWQFDEYPEMNSEICTRCGLERY